MLTDLLNRPLRDLRVSLTDACNFRCTYCMPRDLYGDGYPFMTSDRLLDFDQIEHVVRVGIELGVVKIKLTGGEPTLRPGLSELISRLVRLPGLQDVGLITNGFLLKEMAPSLKAAGLPRLTISLDALSPTTFAEISGRRPQDLQAVLDGIEAAQRLGFQNLKVNMVVQRGLNSHEIIPMADFFRGTGITLRFIEYMDTGTKHHYDKSLLLPSRDLLTLLQQHWPLERTDPHYRGEVATRYRYTDGQGEVGFISSMTQPFCGDCTRLRLSADGKLYRCLFSAFYRDLKPLLIANDTDAIRTAIMKFWGLRKDRYSEIRHKLDPASVDKVEMYRMGG